MLERWLRRSAQATASPGLRLDRLSAGAQDPDVDALTFDEVLWVRDRALGGGLIGPAIVLQLVEAYFEARGTRTSRRASGRQGST
jgi:hypothetical protein